LLYNILHFFTKMYFKKTGQHHAKKINEDVKESATLYKYPFNALRENIISFALQSMKSLLFLHHRCGDGM